MAGHFKDDFPTYTTKVGGIKLNFAKVGTGPALVFIHGWANNWQGWIPIVQYLKDDFTLYLLDLPGFGDSDDMDKYTVENNAKYVALFLKSIKEKKAGVVGLSMGSFVVAEVALRYPLLCQKAILLGPLIKAHTNNPVYKAITFYLRSFNKTDKTRRLLKKIIVNKQVAYLVSKYVNMYRFNKEYIDRYGTVGRKKMRIEAFIGMGLSVNSYNLKQILVQIKIPSLLIYGRQDKIAKAQTAKKILPQNSHLSLSVIPFAGHMVHWEQTEKVARAIKEFITKGSQGIEDRL